MRPQSAINTSTICCLAVCSQSSLEFDQLLATQDQFASSMGGPLRSARFARIVSGGFEQVLQKGGSVGVEQFIKQLGKVSRQAPTTTFGRSPSNQMCRASTIIDWIITHGAALGGGRATPDALVCPTPCIGVVNRVAKG